MYNPTVDEAHNFYVGDGQWLVHNTCHLRDDVARIRQAQPCGPVGAGRNVAVVGWLRSTDSECKILEDIAARFGPDATGMVRIYSERRPCPSCEDVFRQFCEAYPGINLIVDHGP